MSFRPTIYALIVVSAACAATSTQGAETLTTVRVASGLSSPLYVTHAPGDTTRLFIVEQPGRVRILDLTQDPPVLVAAPFLDITGIVRTGGERGLLGMAFHPQYASNGFFYVNYTGFSGASGDTVIARYHVPPATPNDADESSASIVMTIPQPQSNHNGGWIDFSPNDAFLYISMGDGGGAGDTGAGHTNPGGNAQDITSNLLGKMLRIDVDGDDFPGDPNVNYAVPADNPFVSVTGDDEIWAYGLRNSWRNAFDQVTGDLYMADVGQVVAEEVSFQPGSSNGGENYGWRCREGLVAFDSTSSTCLALSPGDYVDPVHQYLHSDPSNPCSITGGEVYRGCAMPNLAGTYFFADFCSNDIWSFKVEGNPPAVTALTNRTTELDPPGAQSIIGISGFGRDAENEIYICDLFDGEVFKIIPENAPAPCSECGNDVREGSEVCDGTDDAACPGQCQVGCVCPYVPPVAGAGDDTCFDGNTDTGTPCTTGDDCPLGQVCGSKARYLSITPPTSAVAGSIPRAIQLTVTDMPQYPDRVGEVWWAGAPALIPNPPFADIPAAGLVCTTTPNFEVWDGTSTVHLFGEIVVPSSTYEVRLCDGVPGPCSAPTSVSTGDWGDAVSPYGGGGQPDFSDITAIVLKFETSAFAPSTARTDLVPAIPDHEVDFQDISAAVDGFQSVPYPNTPPACP